MDALRGLAERARRAWRTLAVADTEVKNAALTNAAQALDDGRGPILLANAADVDAAREKGLSDAFIERLTLTDARIDQMRQGLLEVAALPDPVGEVMEAWERPNGLRFVKRRVPLGVIGIIYESRPNVTVDAAALCLKSGNAVILRGGTDAFLSNRALMEALRTAIGAAGLPEDCAALVHDTSRAAAQHLMTLDGLIDVLIPRGGKGLIDSVVKNATIPVIQTGDGVCHVYVDGRCDRDMAHTIALSAKLSRPSTCNAAETLLVDRAVSGAFLPALLDALHASGVEVRGCLEVCALRPWVVAATEADFSTEYNALIYNVKVVDGIDAAIEHINAHGTRHSEAIITADPARGRYFQSRVDAAAVYVNASTRFTDGGEFGFGAEIGISNQKLHARGPMGLRELTTCQYEITGDGQIR